MADVKAPAAGARPRPLSPHLQIWRWTWTMASSILHRVTGVGLIGGTLILAWWLIAAALGPEAYAVFGLVAGSVLGKLILAGFTLALVYHLLNGIRHLVWDLGVGFDVQTSIAASRVIVIASLVVTALLWAGAYYLKGGL